MAALKERYRVKLIFFGRAWKDYLYWLRAHRKMHDRINKFCEDI